MHSWDAAIHTYMVMSGAPTLTLCCLLKPMSISQRANTYRNGRDFFLHADSYNHTFPQVPGPRASTRIPCFLQGSMSTRSAVKWFFVFPRLARSPAPRSQTMPYTLGNIIPPAQNLSLLSALLCSSLRKTSHGGHQAQHQRFAYVPPRS